MKLAVVGPNKLADKSVVWTAIKKAVRKHRLQITEVVATGEGDTSDEAARWGLAFRKRVRTYAPLPFKSAREYRDRRMVEFSDAVLVLDDFQDETVQRVKKFAKNQGRFLVHVAV